MFYGSGNPGYYKNNVLTTLPAFYTALSNDENYEDLTTHDSGLNGNIIHGKTIRYYAPIYAWAIQDVSQDFINYLKDKYNSREPIIWVPHVDAPLIQKSVFVKYMYRSNINKIMHQKCFVVELYGTTYEGRISVSDDMRMAKKNTAIIST